MLIMFRINVGFSTDEKRWVLRPVEEFGRQATKYSSRRK